MQAARPRFYAAAALEADDAHGGEHRLVTQHYGITYDDLLRVLAMAAQTVDGEHATPRHAALALRPM